MHDDRPYYAAMDFGSNSTLLLLAHVDAGRGLVEDMELFRTTRLGRQLDTTGRLSPEGISSSMSAAADFLRECAESRRRVELVAAATSAVRDAVNRKEFMQRCEEVIGRPPVLLSGEDEARTIFLGATSDRPPEKACLVLDIGGGSSEAAIGTSSRCETACSVDIGCVRLTERFGLSDAADAASLNAACDYARGVCEKFYRKLAGTCGLADLSDLDVLVTGGTATTLAAYSRMLDEYDRGKVHGFESTLEYVSEILGPLAGMSRAERARRPGIPEGRAAVWPAGLVILRELLQIFGAPRFLVSTRGLRFGLVRRLVRGELEAVWRSSQ